MIMSFFSPFKHCKEGSYEFQLDTREKVAYISGHTDGSAVVHLPSEVVYEGVAYTVENTSILAFNDEPMLEEAFVPDSYKCFEHGAFENCPRLRKIHLGMMFGSNDKELIGLIPRNKLGSWDVDCRSLEEVTVAPDNPFIKMSDDGMFILSKSGGQLLAAVKNVVQLTIPEGVEWIAEDAFHGLKDLRTIHLPQSLKGMDAQSMMRKR